MKSFFILLATLFGIISAQTPGTLKWSFDDPIFWITSSPAIDSSGTIYFGGGDGRLYALNPDGTKKWEIFFGDRLQISPAIGGDGTIYLGTSDGKLHAIKPDGTEKWEFGTLRPIVCSPSIASNGTIYFSSDDGRLYAVKSENTRLADTPWPKYAHDNQNSSNVQIISNINDSENNTQIPQKFSLSPIYPNPFNPQTRIKFSLPIKSKVEINVYNIRGQIVAKLIKETKNAGIHNYCLGCFASSHRYVFCTDKSRRFCKNSKMSVNEIDLKQL